MKTHHRFAAVFCTFAALLTGGFSRAEGQTSRLSFLMETANFAHQINPALLLDRPYTAMPLLGNLYVESSGGLNTDTYIYKLSDNGSSRIYGTFMHPYVSSETFRDHLGNRDLRFGVELNENIFSTAFRAFGGTNLIEVNLRTRSHLRLPHELFLFAKKPGTATTYDFGNLGLRHRSYAEISIGHAHAAGKHFTVGAKAKVLLGFSYLNAEAQQLRLDKNADSWRVTGRTAAQAAVLRTPLKFDAKGRPEDLDDFKWGMAGTGAAVDAGLTYRVHGVEGLVLSAAVTDLGFMNYKEAYRLESKGSGTWNFDGFHDVYVGSDATGSKRIGDELEQMGEDLKDLVALHDSEKRGASAALGTSINVGANYALPFANHLNVGMLYCGRFDGAHSRHLAMIGATWHPVKAIELGISATLAEAQVAFGTMVTLQAPGFQIYAAADHPFGGFSKEYIPVGIMNRGINIGFTFPMR